MWRDSTNHHYCPDVCNVLAYISVFEIWLLVQALSWEAPLRVRVYFQCAYLYRACLNREAKWSEIFPAIRPGNRGLHFLCESFTYLTIATLPKINTFDERLYVLYVSVQWRVIILLFLSSWVTPFNITHHYLIHCYYANIEQWVFHKEIPSPASLNN